MIDYPSPGTEPSSSPAEFEGLLIAHQRPILRYIKSLVTNHHEAEDLLQRTNLILWQKRTGFEVGSNFRAWSFAIARLEVLNHLRQRHRDQRVFSDEQNHQVATKVVPTTEESEAPSLLALRDCLRRLPPRDRELLLMRYGTDRKLSEYAKHLNRSPGTLKARLFQIRETLRRNIKERLREIRAADLSWIR